MMNENDDILKKIDEELSDIPNIEQREALPYLKELGFDDQIIEEVLTTLPNEAIVTLKEEEEVVKTNIKYLKDLGINNYQEAFIKFYNMFFLEPQSFDDIFSKYDKEDLIAKLEKNIAIMEHL